MRVKNNKIICECSEQAFCCKDHKPGGCENTAKWIVIFGRRKLVCFSCFSYAFEKSGLQMSNGFSCKGISGNVETFLKEKE